MSASGRRAHYEIRVEGVLDSQWAAWFDGLQVSDDGEETVISGLLADQPALHGVLAKIRDLGLCLISVRLARPRRTGMRGTAMRRERDPGTEGLARSIYRTLRVPNSRRSRRH